MTVLFAGLGILGASVVAAGALILRSSATLFRTAGSVEVDDDALKPAYLREAEATVESLEIQYAVAEDLGQDGGILEDLSRRIHSAKQAVENARKTAAEQLGLQSTADTAVPPAVVPVPVRSQLPNG